MDTFVKNLMKLNIVASDLINGNSSYVRSDCLGYLDTFAWSDIVLKTRPLNQKNIPEMVEEYLATVSPEILSYLKGFNKPFNEILEDYFQKYKYVYHVMCRKYYPVSYCTISRIAFYWVNSTEDQLSVQDLTNIYVYFNETTLAEILRNVYPIDSLVKILQYETRLGHKFPMRSIPKLLKFVNDPITLIYLKKYGGNPLSRNEMLDKLSDIVKQADIDVIVRQLHPNFTKYKYFKGLGVAFSYWRYAKPAILTKLIEKYKIEARDTTSALRFMYITGIFGSRADEWISKHIKLTPNKPLNLILHDTTLGIPAPKKWGEPKLAQLLLKHPNAPLHERRLIVNNWDDKYAGLSWKKTLIAIATRNYDDIQCQEFAFEAGRWSLPENTYNFYENLYLKSQTVPEIFPQVSKLSYEYENYVCRILPRSDVRTMFFGNYTGCCQHIDEGDAETSAISSQRDSFSGLLVVEKKGVIIAGAWVWRTGDSMCLDNIEMQDGQDDQEILWFVIDPYCRMIKSRYRLNTITVGKSYSDVDISALPEVNYPLLLPFEYTGYTDAEHQKLVCGNHPLPSMPEKPFVRGILNTDDISIECGYVLYDPYDDEYVEYFTYSEIMETVCYSLQDINIVDFEAYFLPYFLKLFDRLDNWQIPIGAIADFLIDKGHIVLNDSWDSNGLGWVSRPCS